MTREAAIRASFETQAIWCERLGSPFTALLCETLASALDRDTPVGRRVLGWSGDPSPGGDALALRLCGGLHALVRSGGAPELSSLYPPRPLPGGAGLGEKLVPILAGSDLLPWLDRAPQTNEVGRSAVLMAGLLTAAARFGLPFDLFELGASAGLNLQLDRYGYDLGGLAAGATGSSVHLRPEWRGAAPPDAEVRIARRAGVDLNPLDPGEHGERLLAYIWPDQPERLRRTEAALALAAADPPPVEAGDAADWIEGRPGGSAARGVTRAVMHSVAFQYFPADVQARVARHIAHLGAEASEESPLIWLRFEKLPQDERFSLRLRTWPGEDRLLARAHPHASDVEWLG